MKKRMKKITPHPAPRNIISVFQVKALGVG
jgi:hypothetical protein